MKLKFLGFPGNIKLNNINFYKLTKNIAGIGFLESEK